MAEALLRKRLKDKEMTGIEVSSAGIVLMTGFSPTDNTLKIMEKEGIDVSGHKAAKLTLEIIEDADLILTMELIHKHKVLNLIPEAKDKTFLLKEYVNKKDKATGYVVPDPIGLPMEVYERIFNMIKESIEELVKKL